MTKTEMIQGIEKIKQSLLESNNSWYAEQLETLKNELIEEWNNIDYYYEKERNLQE